MQDFQPRKANPHEASEEEEKEDFFFFFLPLEGEEGDPSAIHREFPTY